MGKISYNINPSDKEKGVKGYLDSVYKCGYKSCDILTNCLYKQEGSINLRRACCQEHADLQGD